MVGWIAGILLAGAAVLLLGWLVARFYLEGPDLSNFDGPVEDRPPQAGRRGPEYVEVLRFMEQTSEAVLAAPRRKRLATARRLLDAGMTGATPTAEDLGVRIVAADAGGVQAEWIIAPGADPGRRLLYLHGGSFVMGSPRSHRGLTAALSGAAGVSVLAIDYRLMPECSRRAGIADCRAAYRWILSNGPEGAAAASRAFVAGDSAGGNLALMLIAWARDEGLRQADAALAISPVTDMTLSSPSLLRNRPSDPMLRRALQPLLRLPRPVMLWLLWIGSRINPHSPLISPVFGDLGGLPPILIHASQTEMMLDDARRYVNKARAAGSPARLETWPDMFHAWHVFAQVLPEAKEAIGCIGRFLAECGRLPLGLSVHPQDAPGPKRQ